ncbi:MAG TPA: GntR family transcriptional regulator [Candidatus Binataceae bacterium]|nr:GntR family transcriptional regulator [Candidatus Binataceae bacterium]
MVKRHQGAAAQVHQILRQALLQSKFPAGERLIETQLAEMLGVSRTPIREALSKLEAEGLVEAAPSGGVVVRDLQAELVEIYGLRQRLEGYAAALAATQITDGELAALDDVRQQAFAMIDQPSPERRAELNNRFHGLLTEASHSPRLLRLVNDYRDYFLTPEFILYYDRATGVRQHEQHREIVEALRRHDAERCEQLVKDHFERALAVIRQGLAATQASAQAETPESREVGR